MYYGRLSEEAQLILMFARLHPNDKRTAEEALEDSKNAVIETGELVSQKRISLTARGGMPQNSVNAER